MTTEIGYVYLARITTLDNSSHIKSDTLWEDAFQSTRYLERFKLGRTDGPPLKRIKKVARDAGSLVNTYWSIAIENPLPISDTTAKTQYFNHHIQSPKALENFLAACLHKDRIQDTEWYQGPTVNQLFERLTARKQLREADRLQEKHGQDQLALFLPQDAEALHNVLARMNVAKFYNSPDGTKPFSWGKWHLSSLTEEISQGAKTMAFTNIVK